ncbi:CLUMA_CG013359, isoform A [Clunio marinus]|uniref:CLUMA_CG013359, isoform A n=1 Tax=Clunio marinus TaxID=568069 RepID=A0A1J1IKL4_9DIPT|nr:CLUMA_CG013359, isoform A [Clunio marinus]
MLLLVSSVFAFLNLPSYVMRIKAFLVENENESQGVVITQFGKSTVSNEKQFITLQYPRLTSC